MYIVKSKSEFISRMKKIIIVSIILLATSCSKKPDIFPENFFNLKLTQKMTGDEAASFVNRLHFDSVTSEKNEIGFYRGSKGNAVIYVTYYENEKSALDSFVKMTQKISPENSVFIKGSLIKISGKRIYRTFGMGQTHYVFTSGNKLFWISAETIWAINFLNDYLNFLE